MADKGIYDQAVDEILRLRGLVGEEIIRRNKGKRPFRMEPVSPKEQLLQFSQMTQQDEDMMRQEMGDAPVDNYLLDMDDIARRNQNG